MILVYRLRAKVNNQLLFSRSRQFFDGVFALASTGAVCECFAIHQTDRPTTTGITCAFVTAIFTIMFIKTTF